MHSTGILTELLKSFNCFCSDYFYGNIDKWLLKGECVDDFKKQ